MDLNTLSGNVLFLKLARAVALHKGRFACATVADEDELPGGDLGGGSHVGDREK